ncbi:DUF1189 domain-containing protein [Exiguobacterium sp. SL-9]|uniref:DUF1189 domain-containing protein n=1 Tax=Exiguobacterium sp. SL-9 TaxID=2510963 RepID=UPI00103F9815|nr:DUF1189 domain-containing protein [Exiguobacterium sp. SL-9]TCI21633.1 DUF1189 domain-containing protein [Exiguobacterium sp. SL-9]
MEQVIASLGFQFEKVQAWRKQSIWKSIFYVIIAVLMANALVFGLKWVNQSNEAATELPVFTVTEDGIQYEEPFLFNMEVLDLTVMVGEERETDALQTLLLEDSGWVFKRSGVSTDLKAYSSLLGFLGETELTERDVAQILEDLKWFYPLYIYGAIVVDVLIHLVVISFLALAGLGFRRFVPIRYKEAWTITAYGITAPLLVRTVIALLPVTVPMLSVLYWATVGIFAFMTIRKIGDE